jgi:chlorite dismutase
MEANIEKPDIDEKGGRGQRSDRRLFMQLLAFGDCHEVGPVVGALEAANLSAVVYADVNDPQGIALLTMSERPEFFVDELRPVLQQQPFTSMALKPQYTMFGRTYSLGYEPDLQDTLLQRPRRHVLTAQWPWAIWYPLRRSGAFQRLDAEQQKQILREHGEIGFAFGRADYAHDVRLACFGLDKDDNDFVIGLIGGQLAPLSKVVETMRKTTQTSLYIDKLGPFFVGKAVWQSPLDAP